MTATDQTRPPTHASRKANAFAAAGVQSLLGLGVCASPEIESSTAMKGFHDDHWGDPSWKGLLGGRRRGHHLVCTMRSRSGCIVPSDYSAGPTPTPGGKGEVADPSRTILGRPFICVNKKCDRSACVNCRSPCPLARMRPTIDESPRMDPWDSPWRARSRVRSSA